MYYFFSPKTHRGLRVWDNGKKLAVFENMADYGCFTTEDEEIANALRAYPLFNKAFRESTDGKVPNFDKPPQVNYKIENDQVETVTFDTVPEAKVVIVETKPDMSKYIRYGELKVKLFNEKGEIKKPSPTFKKEEIATLLTEFNELKKQIEV